METKNKVWFLRNWTLLNASFFVIGYILIIVFGILIMEIFPLPKDEWGSPLRQSMWQIGNAILIGISLGYIQWRMLRKRYGVSATWIYLVPAGMILTELIAGILLWKMGINRGEFAFWENNPLHHALIASIYGLVIGLIQFPIIRKHFNKGAFWIATSTLAWGVSILITAIEVQNDIILLLEFIIGLLLYGLITGATLMWILKPKDIEA